MQITRFEDLFEEATTSNLYTKLVQQLNKDFLFATIHLDFTENIAPLQLKQDLHNVVYKLIQEDFTRYLNLLYIIDVSEETIKKLNGDDTVILAEQVAFLILKREWQKVWFRKQYS